MDPCKPLTGISKVTVVPSSGMGWLTVLEKVWAERQRQDKKEITKINNFCIELERLRPVPFRLRKCTMINKKSEK